MKNVKKAIAFFSALTLMGTFTACGRTDSSTSAETSAEPSVTTETTPAKELDEEDKAAVA